MSDSKRRKISHENEKEAQEYDANELSLSPANNAQPNFEIDSQLNDESATQLSSSVIIADNPEACFGALYDIPVIPMSDANIQRQPHTLRWDGSKFLKCDKTEASLYELPVRALSVFKTLSRKARVIFEITLKLSEDGKSNSSANHCAESLSPNLFKISVNLYGSLSFADAVGDFLQQCRLYLQEPERCGYNVPYMNPHCLSSPTDIVLMTSVFNGKPVDDSALVNSIEEDLFCDESYGVEHITEETQPELVRTPLQSHQKKALSFMLRRERGWDLSGLHRDVWRSYTDRFGKTRYQNTLSNATQAEPPRDFRGGILADYMGLGKTLSMLSLIAATKSSSSECSCKDSRERPNALSSSPFVKGTLIIVPLSLLTVWENQIKEHLSPTFRTLVYRNRGRRVKELSVYDIVITTYNITSTEWKTRRRGLSNGQNLFDLTWHRLVLDEAHMIRQANTRNAKAVCALNAIHRWCITGTPLQNRVSDISSLLQFLRVYPFHEPKTFEKVIIQPWKREIDKKPLQRLRALVTMIGLHRTKKAINLPSREDIIKKVNFSTEEQVMYNNAREGIIQLLHQSLSSDISKGLAYMNAFQRINKMRYICNHGVHHRECDPELKGKPYKEQEDGLAELQHDHLIDHSVEVCLGCGTDLVEEKELSYQNDITVTKQAEQLSLCTDCLRKRIGEQADTQYLATPPSSQPRTPMMEEVEIELPSKINAVVSYVRNIPDEDKCVIFSFWTSTLDLMQQGLDRAGISCCRYQGSSRYEKRTETLKKFRHDPTLRIMLVSITCGGSGLNLTVANHCILLEPQWNPMIEAQATSRVHRLGQTKPTTIARFIVSDTIEQMILERQERKQVLADLILGRDRLKEGDDGKKQLMHLLQLVR